MSFLCVNSSTGFLLRVELNSTSCDLQALLDETLLFPILYSRFMPFLPAHLHRSFAIPFLSPSKLTLPSLLQSISISVWDSHLMLFTWQTSHLPGVRFNFRRAPLPTGCREDPPPGPLLSITAWASLQLLQFVPVLSVFLFLFVSYSPHWVGALWSGEIHNSFCLWSDNIWTRTGYQSYLSQRVQKRKPRGRIRDLGTRRSRLSPSLVSWQAEWLHFPRM